MISHGVCWYMASKACFLSSLNGLSCRKSHSMAGSLTGRGVSITSAKELITMRLSRVWGHLLEVFLGEASAAETAKIHPKIHGFPVKSWWIGRCSHGDAEAKADKKKVGMYFTTPLYEFAMNCGG